jgi:hypothetical protein
MLRFAACAFRTVLWPSKENEDDNQDKLAEYLARGQKQ